jgi:cyclohexanone monooxygenase
VASPDAANQTLELADFEKMEQIRKRVSETVRDPKTAEALKPYYRQFCKRPTFNDDYLPSFNRPNVTLVDTDGHGVERVTETGVVAGGALYALDCLIFATGFEVGTAYTRRAGYDMIGRGGVKLSEKWANGVRSLHGLHSHGFPNLMIMGAQQAAFTANYPHLLADQSRHIAYVIGETQRRGARTFEAKREAEDAWVQTIVELSRFGRDFLEACTPGYYNNEGKVGGIAVQNGAYGLGSEPFFKLMQEWRDAGRLDGLELTS